ncbi:MAG: hypothetical protein KDA42_11660 [Planctomycetales bacterium]|nr:hypothetical protein [Planctomycetales bacterium]
MKSPILCKSSFAAATCLAFTWLAANSAQANLFVSPLANLASAEHVEAMPAPASGVCCPDYCVKHRHHRGKKICCGCCEPQRVCLEVADPLRCGCCVQVPVCLPGCCEGAPCVTKHCGPLGRGYVTFQWCCGYRVVVAFHVHTPTVIVHSYGH